LAINVTMPKWGLTMKEGKISKWYKNEGDSVQKGEDLYEVETEKITNTVESPETGILFQIVVQVGTKVPVGAVLAVIAEPGEEPGRIDGIQVGEVVEDTAESKEGMADAERPSEKKFVFASPAARRLAKEMGIDLNLIQGTGPKGRIIEADVAGYQEEAPTMYRITPLAEEIARQEGLDISTVSGTGEEGKITKEDVERALETRISEEKEKPVKAIPFTGMRKAIADNMYASLQNTAQLTVFTEVDVTEMVQFRDLVMEENKKDKTVRVSFNDIIILATSRALKQFPMMNSALADDEILLHESVNMGIAVSLPEGLIVPVLRNADSKGLLRIARESRELARKAREGTLDLDEVTGGTFTISNVSMLGMDGFTPILRPPETGILGIGRVKEKPIVSDGEIAIGSLMYLSLTFDHRVLDGAPAMVFLQTLARYLQHPTLIMT